MKITQKDINRFFEKVSPPNKNECWEWLYVGKGRYGKFSLHGKKFQAHRLSYFIYNGYMPKKDEYVCHKCDNPKCVNPDHLFLGTQQDNMDDMVSKGRSPNNHGDRNPRATLSQEDVDRMRLMYKNGMTRMEISSIFNTTETTTHNILSGRTWSHSGYKNPKIKPANRVVTKEIVEKVNKLRKTTSMSQSKIGEIVGISQAVVSRILLNQTSAWDA